MKSSHLIALIHIISMVLIVGVLIVAAFGYVNDDKAYINVGTNTHEIGKCSFKEHFGFDCPSCGLTRSFICIEEFNFAKAIRYNSMGVCVYSLFVLTLLFNIISLKRVRFASKYGIVLGIYAGLILLGLVVRWIINIFF